MTPGARIAAAIEILDQIVAGDPAERVLTTWARQHRFAGSGDRAAIRDHVFDVLRRLHSSAALGGAMTGRGLMIGSLRAQGIAPYTLFTGEGHAPAPLTGPEHEIPEPASIETRLDCPAWLAPHLRRALGADFEPAMALLQTRAPLFLRVNSAKSTREQAQQALASEGIVTQTSPLADTALEVLQNPRRVQASMPYREGWIEVQDAASQAISALVPISAGQRVLDYCAGGGGKSLAMASRCPDANIFAHDIDPGRMADLPARAARAGASISQLTPEAIENKPLFDVVVVDAPCSGSGAWRRSPQGKWQLTQAKLDDLVVLQSEILHRSAHLVRPNGRLVYMTCSMLDVENNEQLNQFVQSQKGWQVQTQRSFTPTMGGDGFFVAILARC